jgi:hypothetical protein
VRRNLAFERLRCEAHARPRLFQDVAKLGAVQLGIGRHSGEAGMPDRIKHFEIVGAVRGGDGDALAGRQPEGVQRAGKPRHAARHFAIAAQHARAKPERRPLRIVGGDAFKP